MTKINLIRRQTITIDEFRAWLTQLIQDKKGALPDLNDWKLIKEKLDKVGSRRDINDDGSGYSILQNDDDEYAFACGGAEPYDDQMTLDLFDRLCEETEIEYDNNVLARDGVFNDFHNEYVRKIKTTEWEANEILACVVREMYKEYDNGKTKTECNTSTSSSTSST